MLSCRQNACRRREGRHFLQLPTPSPKKEPRMPPKFLQTVPRKEFCGQNSSKPIRGRNLADKIRPNHFAEGIWRTRFVQSISRKEFGRQDSSKPIRGRDLVDQIRSAEWIEKKRNPLLEIPLLLLFCGWQRFHPYMIIRLIIQRSSLRQPCVCSYADAIWRFLRQRQTVRRLRPDIAS